MKKKMVLIEEPLCLCNQEFDDPYIFDVKTDTYKCKFCFSTFKEPHDIETYGCPNCQD